MSRASRTAAVVFDLDGTLVDSMPLVLASIVHAIEPYGPALPATDIFARLGGPPERFMAGLVTDPRNTAAAVQRMQQFHHDNHHLIRPFDGVRAMLEKLRARDISIGLWTGRDRSGTHWLLAHHGLTAFFDAIVCGDDLPTHKPDPQGLRELILRLEVPAREMLLVGDADVDVLGGVACDVDTVLIRHGRTIDETVTARAWRSVPTPTAAYDLVLNCVA